MRILKRVLATSGLTATIAALVLAASAGADTPDRIKGACLVGATAKTLPPVPFVGGTVGYTFWTLAFPCVAVELSKGTAVAAGLIHLAVSSSGTYTNVVCGTGKVTSTPNGAVVQGAQVVPIVGNWRTDSLAEWEALADDLDYTIEFVALSGVLKWTDSPAQKLSSGAPKIITPGSTGYPGGYVQLLGDPTKGSSFPSTCTKAFQIMGALTIDWAPSNPIV